MIPRRVVMIQRSARLLVLISFAAALLLSFPTSTAAVEVVRIRSPHSVGEEQQDPGRTAAGAEFLSIRPPPRRVFRPFDARAAYSAARAAAAAAADDGASSRNNDDKTRLKKEEEKVVTAVVAQQDGVLATLQSSAEEEEEDLQQSSYAAAGTPATTAVVAEEEDLLNTGKRIGTPQPCLLQQSGQWRQETQPPKKTADDCSSAAATSVVLVHAG